MDRAGIARINALYAELAPIERVLALHEPHIILMTFTEGGGSDQTPVSTRAMTLSPQMIEAIRVRLRERHAAIAAELKELGVTGIEPCEPEPEPAHQARPHARSKRR